jgi:hypothetical protein
VGLKPSVSKKNKEYVKSLPCLVTGRYGVDPCHIIRRSQGGPDTLLNLIPLVREMHRRYDEYKEPYRTQIDELALYFHHRLLDSGCFSVVELGDPYWIPKEE